MSRLKRRLARARGVRLPSSWPAAVQRQAAEVQRLLPGVTETARQLNKETQRFQARADAFRVRREALKASFVAAESSLRVHKAIAASGLPGDDGGRQQDGGGEIRAAEARLADLTAQMEREAGQQPWPAGLMALRPGALDRDDICILFAVEPPGAALLIAVLEGLDAVAERYGKPSWPPPTCYGTCGLARRPRRRAHTYDSTESFLAEFAAGAGGSHP
jgi:hypothetical protein